MESEIKIGIRDTERLAKLEQTDGKIGFVDRQTDRQKDWEKIKQTGRKTNKN